MGCAASPKGMRDQSLMVISSAFFPQKKTPRTAENYARESRILKQARQDVRVTASMLTGSTEVAATPSLM